MTAVVVNLPVRRKAAPRKPDPLDKGCSQKACVYCGGLLFVILSSFDGEHTAVKCATPKCGAVGIEISPPDEPEGGQAA